MPPSGHFSFPGNLWYNISREDKKPADFSPEKQAGIIPAGL